MKLIIEFLVFLVPTITVFLAGLYLPYKYRNQMGMVQLLGWLAVSILAGVIVLCAFRFLCVPKQLPQQSEPFVVQEAVSSSASSTSMLINIPIAPQVTKFKMRARAATYIRVAPTTDAKVVRVLRKNDVVDIEKTEGEDWARILIDDGEPHFINTLWLDNVENLPSPISFTHSSSSNASTSAASKAVNSKAVK